MSRKKTKPKRKPVSEWNKCCKPFMAKALVAAKKAYSVKHRPPDPRKLASLRKQKEVIATKIRKELRKD